MCDKELTEKTPAGGQLVDIPGIGACRLPAEFAVFTGPLERVEVHGARESPSALLELLAAGTGVVLTGPYAYVDAVFRYCQRFQRRLVAREEVAGVAGRTRRIAAYTEARWRKLHRLVLLARGEELLEVQDAPETGGLGRWLNEPTGGGRFLIPVRRLQRILTDMRRAAEGLFIEPLGATITILPHVYVPADQSVPAMFVEYRHLIAGRRVLDMGTGTGVLALLAARLGAAKVVATDSSEHAVANARANVERLGLANVVEVRGPADLFEAVAGESFDAILFNAPWMAGEPRTLYEAANYDPGYRVLEGFVRGAPGRLAAGGAILLQYSDVSQRTGEGGMDHLYSALAAGGLVIDSSRSMARVSRVLGSRERVWLLEIRRGEACT